MAVLFHFRKLCFLLLFLAPICALAQKSMESHVDSMKLAFSRKDSARRLAAEKNMGDAKFYHTIREIIYSSGKTEFTGIKQISMQADKFHGACYLNLNVKAVFGKPIAPNTPTRLTLVAVDHSSISLESMGKGMLTGTEQRNLSELKLSFALSEDQTAFLTGKQVISLVLNCGGVDWKVDIDQNKSEKIKKTMSVN